MGISISPQRTRRTQRFTIFTHYRVTQSLTYLESYLLLCFTYGNKREELCVLRVLCGELI